MRHLFVVDSPDKQMQNEKELIRLASAGMGGLFVKIQNRGPEQEIPAVTCVRLIAQETSILAPWIVRYSTDIGK